MFYLSKPSISIENNIIMNSRLHRITQYYLTSILENEQAIQNLKKEIPNFDTIFIQVCTYICYIIIYCETIRREFIKLYF